MALETCPVHMIVFAFQNHTVSPVSQADTPWFALCLSLATVRWKPGSNIAIAFTDLVRIFSLILAAEWRLAADIDRGMVKRDCSTKRVPVSCSIRLFIIDELDGPLNWVLVTPG